MNRPPSIAYAAVGAWFVALAYLLINNIGIAGTLAGCVANALVIATMIGLWKFCRWLRRMQVEGDMPEARLTPNPDHPTKNHGKH